MSEIRVSQTAKATYIQSKFYQALGRFIAEWSNLEYVLGASFVQIVGDQDYRKKKALYLAFCSSRNFNTKRDLFDAALEAIPESPRKDFAKAISKKSGQYVTFRNRAAHDAVSMMGTRMEINAHKNWAERDASGPDAITLEKLKAAAKRVEALAGLASSVLLFQHKPEVVLPQVEALPNEADFPLGVPIPPKKQPRALKPRRSKKP
jgi:hypothetical protein